MDIFIIHDPVDKGKTAQKVRQEVPDAYFPMICAKPAGKSFVNKNITDVREDNWIIFSWDSESRFMEPIAGR